MQDGPLPRKPGARPDFADRNAQHAAAARLVPSSDCEGPVDYRTPLQHLLRNLLPTRAATVSPAAAPEFMDTQPDSERPASVQSLRPVASPRRQPGIWDESAIDLVLGTDIMEYPEDTAADLMDEFFDQSNKRAA